MVAIINIENNNDISAFLTIALISHTQKVESTRAIVDLWDAIRKNVILNSKPQIISALLATGRILDLKKELMDQKFISTINELIESIYHDLEKRENVSEINDSHFVTAFITSAYISRTNEIETTNAIIDFWLELSSKLKLEDDVDKIAGILTTGRLLEEKYKINDMDQILDLFNIIKNALSNLVGGRQLSQKDVAAAFLTNANVEISPNVEKIQNIIDMWSKFGKKLLIKDDIDYTVTLLTYGRIRDINVQFFVSDSVISEIKSSIRTQINSKI